MVGLTDLKRVAFDAFTKLPLSVKKVLVKPITRYNNYQLKQLKTPKSLTFFVTTKCNLKCSHCFYSAELNQPDIQELSLEEIDKIISSFNHPIESVSLTGGETFLRRDIVEISKILHEKGKVKYFNIVTNGYFTNVVIDKVKQIAVFPGTRLNLHVSIDGFEQTHDKIRGSDSSFARAVETVKQAKSIPGIDICVVTSIHKGNYQEVPALIDFVKGLGVRHKFQYVRGSWRDVQQINPKILSDFNPKDEECSVLLPKEVVYKLNEILNQHDPDKSQILKREYFIKHLYEKKKMLDCKAGYLDGVIYPNGDVAMCEMTIPFANLRNFSFDMEKLWNSDEAGKMRRQTSACFCTHSCNLIRSMYYDEKSLLRLTS